MLGYTSSQFAGKAVPVLRHDTVDVAKWIGRNYTPQAHAFLWPGPRLCMSLCSRAPQQVVADCLGSTPKIRRPARCSEAHRALLSSAQRFAQMHPPPARSLRPDRRSTCSLLTPLTAHPCSPLTHPCSPRLNPVQPCSPPAHPPAHLLLNLLTPHSPYCSLLLTPAHPLLTPAHPCSTLCSTLLISCSPSCSPPAQPAHFSLPSLLTC